MHKPLKTITVVLAAVVAAGASPAVASAAPKTKAAASTCQGQTAEGVDPYLFRLPLFASTTIMGHLVVPDNRKISVDGVTDSWDGLLHTTPGSRDAFRLVTEGLSYRTFVGDRALPLDGTAAWIPAWAIKQKGKWSKCTAGLPVVAFNPLG